ncbi:glycosyltransferase family 2 protein [Cellulomonas sp.]|uniref:glycosyltransferase n=1 Tax=Cellulomonas sp. TaxID=40001 RepID=UPI0025C017AD|nr:glycosyltransferase family 2 protein [Cellulomonas sp.]
MDQPTRAETTRAQRARRSPPTGRRVDLTGWPMDGDLLPAEYVLPLRWQRDDALDELTDYLTDLVTHVPVTVVDGSPEPLFAAHRAAWPPNVRHVPPAPWPGRNGKVAGVMTGVHLARAEAAVIADDDVRWTVAELRTALALLDGADVVRVQNVFRPLPWHARWDTARTLVNRGLGDDFPGTLVVRRSRLLHAGGYDGDVLFENLELIRTVVAAGGREVRAPGLCVARRPPSSRTFWSQRVRQAYDSFAQPARLAAEAAVLPVLLAALVRRRPAPVVSVLGAVTLVAWHGRHRAGGAGVFPASAVALAPVWLLERAVCTWVALAMRLTGGVPYRGRRLVRAASSVAALRRRAVL